MNAVGSDALSCVCDIDCAGTWDRFKKHVDMPDIVFQMLGEDESLSAVNLALSRLSTEAVLKLKATCAVSFLLIEAFDPLEKKELAPSSGFYASMSKFCMIRLECGSQNWKTWYCEKENESKERSKRKRSRNGPATAYVACVKYAERRYFLMVLLLAADSELERRRAEKKM